jgi:hypothetical protein
MFWCLFYFTIFRIEKCAPFQAVKQKCHKPSCPGLGAKQKVWWNRVEKIFQM